jgi:hypothetical protein
LENSPKARLWRQRRCGQRVALRQLNLVELGQSGAGDPDVGAPESEGVFLLAFLMSRIRVVAAGLGAVVQLERAEQLRRLDNGPAPASDAGWIVKDHAPGRGPNMFERPAQLVADSFGSLAPIHLHKAHVGERQGPTSMCGIGGMVSACPNRPVAPAGHTVLLKASRSGRFRRSPQPEGDLKHLDSLGIESSDISSCLSSTPFPPRLQVNLESKYQDNRVCQTAGLGNPLRQIQVVDTLSVAFYGRYCL